MTAIVVFGVIAILVAAALTVYFRLTRDPGGTHRVTGWEPAELRQLAGPEVHHEWNASPPPWPPEVARPRGQGGDQTPARVPVAPWRGRRADHQEADANPGGGQSPHRGDVQGRDGGCVPPESRPAARADLTGSMSPRPTKEGPQAVSTPLPGGTPAFLGAPLLAPVTGDLWPQHVPAAPGGDEAPGPAHPPPPRRDDGRAAAAAVTAPGPGDLPAVTAAVKAMDLDAYAASLPACPWATGEFARILAEVP